MERLNFENPIFWCFPNFLQHFAVNDFLKSFAECLTRFWVFSFLKIIFRLRIWNEIRENLEQNCCFKTVFFFALLKWIFGVCLYLLCLSLWKCFLGGCRFENTFWRFSLWIFLGADRCENFFCSYCCENYFWLQSLTSLKMIFCSCRFWR